MVRPRSSATPCHTSQCISSFGLEMGKKRVICVFYRPAAATIYLKKMPVYHSWLLFMWPGGSHSLNSTKVSGTCVYCR